MYSTLLARTGALLRCRLAYLYKSSARTVVAVWAHRRAVIIVGIALTAVTAGCASLNPRADIERSAEAVERAVGVSADAVTRDNEFAETTTRELFAGGLTSDEAVQVALLNNPRIRSAMLSIGVSRADFVQSTLYSNPSIFLSFRLPDGGGRTNVEFNLAQSIAELWLVPARKEAAQRDLDRAVLNAAQTTAEIVWDVRKAYIEAVQAESQVDLGDVGLRISLDLVEMSELRRQAGSGSEVDVNLARSQRLQSEINYRNARLAMIEARAALCNLLGHTGNPEQLTLVDRLSQPPTENMTADRLQTIARAARLDVQAMDQAIASAEALVQLERARFLRSVDIGFAFELAERRTQGNRNWLSETYYNSVQANALTPPNFMPQSSQNVTNTIAGPTISMELPIWDQNQAQIAKADRLLEQARRQRDAMLVDVAQGIYAGLAKARTSAENARFYHDEFVPTAEKSVSLAKEGYRIGRIPFLSLLEAQRAYLTTRGNELGALRDAANAAIDLERITGRPAPELVGETNHTNPTEERAS